MVFEEVAVNWKKKLVAFQMSEPVNPRLLLKLLLLLGHWGHTQLILGWHHPRLPWKDSLELLHVYLARSIGERRLVIDRLLSMGVTIHHGGRLHDFI